MIVLVENIYGCLVVCAEEAQENSHRNAPKFLDVAALIPDTPNHTLCFPPLAFVTTHRNTQQT